MVFCNYLAYLGYVISINIIVGQTSSVTKNRQCRQRFQLCSVIVANTPLKVEKKITKYEQFWRTSCINNIHRQEEKTPYCHEIPKPAALKFPKLEDKIAKLANLSIVIQGCQVFGNVWLLPKVNKSTTT